MLHVSIGPLHITLFTMLCRYNSLKTLYENNISITTLNVGDGVIMAQ